MSWLKELLDPELRAWKTDKVSAGKGSEDESKSNGEIKEFRVRG